MDILKLLTFLTSQYATARNMFENFKLWRTFKGLPGRACSLILDVLNSEKTLHVSGNGVRLGSDVRIIDGAEELVKELETYSLIKHVTGTEYAPTRRARRSKGRLTAISDERLITRAPQTLLDLFTESAIERDAPLFVCLQRFGGFYGAVEFCVTRIIDGKSETVSRAARSGYGEIIGFLAEENLVVNWKPTGFIGSPADSVVLSLLKDRGQISGQITERAERVAKLLKK